MSKSKYRSVPVKRFEADKLRGVVETTSPLVLAVDVAKTKNKAAITQRGAALGMLSWNAPAETKEVVALVEELGKLSRVEVVMESTGTYGDPLRAQFAKLGVPVFQVRTTLTNECAEIFDHVPSMHDAKAAQVLAWLHEQRRSHEWKVKPEDERDLAAEVAMHDTWDRALTRCLNQIEAMLARHFPELTEEVDLTNASTLALLERYGTPKAIARAGVEAVEHMCRVGGVLLAREKPEAVVAAARSTTGMPMTEGELRAMKILAAEALRQRHQKAESHRRITKLGEKFDAIRRMSEVVGMVTAAVLFSEAGDPAAYQAPAAIVKGLGLNLKEKSSGDHVGELKITKRGSPLARRWLYMAVLRLIQSEPLFKAWYARKVARDSTEKKKVTLKASTALMRKLASALWHVARGSAFDPKRLFDARQLGLAD